MVPPRNVCKLRKNAVTYIPPSRHIRKKHVATNNQLDQLLVHHYWDQLFAIFIVMTRRLNSNT
jgi:hypothetical protein